MTYARSLNADDKILMAAVLLNAGVKARIAKVGASSYRVVFKSSVDAAADALNDAGFRAATGALFSRTHCVSPQQMFVRCAAI